MKKILNLKDLMIEQLRALYHGEKDLGGLLPVIVKNSFDPRLQQITKDYLADNGSQLLRLRQVFELLYVQKRGENCQAMHAMIKETYDLIIRSSDPEVRDAGLITAMQHIMHYKMAGYGAVCTYVKLLAHHEIGQVMHISLETERKADRKLAMLADGLLNIRAIQGESF